jgi:single-stranded-DNA-specific exonuclease
VIGLVAGRLAEKYARPTVLLVSSDDGRARGSARSTPGVNITAALTLIRDRLTGFGGHPGAAGLSLRAGDVSLFRQELSRAVDAIWDRAAAPAGTQIDAFVPLTGLTLELARQIERLAPFGEGNPSPTLAVRDVVIAHARSFGRRGEHREVTLEDGQGASQKVVWWRGADEDLPQGRLDVALTLRSTDIRGAQMLSIEWVDARLIEAVPAEVSAPTVEMVDWRHVFGVAQRVKELAASGNVMVWADGELPAETASRRRLDLEPAQTLVIWRASAGPKELEWVMERVSPKTVYVCDDGAANDRLDLFVKRLAGLLKYDLGRREGRVDVSRLASAAGQRPATVRKGIEWLAAKGQIAILDKDGDALRISLPDHTDNAAHDAPLEDIELQLRGLLAETAAYRAYYRHADVQNLG